MSFSIGAAVAGVQLVLANGLRRRKRRAWRPMVGIVSAGIRTHLERTSLVALSLNVALLALLLSARREFTARAEPASRSPVGITFVLMASVSFGAGLALTAEQAPPQRHREDEVGDADPSGGTRRAD